MFPVIIIPAYKPQPLLLDILMLLSHNSEQKIIIVDDGSGENYQAIFEKAKKLSGVTVLHHANNLGKGQALKTGFNYFLLHFSDASPGVVTVDADGQHLEKDIQKISVALVNEPQALHLGSRHFARSIPLRSWLGNILTRFIFRLLLGKKISDTQTGLRAIPKKLLPGLMKIRSSHYEFELDMLIYAVNKNNPIRETSIETVYENNNVGSHFNPILDSLRIYFVFLRFSTLSIATAILDYSVFVMLFSLTNLILLSFIGARIVAGSFNFYFNKSFVFNSQDHLIKKAWKFSALVLGFMLVSYAVVRFLVHDFGVNIYLAKVLTEGFLFFSSFAIQRIFIFNE